jgi:phospholipid/cholesterol/gamma-HCH transport system substrate-binding protein
MGVNKTALVGAFVIGGLLLFAVGLFMIGDRRMLFGATFPIYAEFASIAGLDNGALVRVAGMQAGEVEAIQVPNAPSGRFRVRMRLREDLRQLVRLDSIASIQNDGLVGNKFVQIEPGTDASPAIPDQGTIQSREPFDIADLMQQMSDTIDTVNKTIVDVQVQLNDALMAISSTAATAQTVMNDVGRDARRIMASTNSVADDVQAIVAGVRSGKGTVGQLLNDDALYQRAKQIAAEAERAMANVRQATEEAKSALAELRGKDGPVSGLTADLHQTLSAARDAMADLAENTEALKRSFFFRGYFNRRGYFDLDDVTVESYRKGALASDGRRPLRIWLKAGLLFERDPSGQERLSDSGRARVDSAMSAFVKYPKSSLLVVEGYGEAATADERFLLSRSRAQVVKDYIVGKFGWDPGATTIMPMGAEAEDSPGPDGNRWDGVAITLFVPATATKG